MLESLLLSILSGIIVGLVVTAWLRVFIRHHIEMLQEDDIEIHSKIIKAYIEETEDQLLIYEYGSNAFLAQGKDWESLNSILVSRYPGVMFDVPTSQIEQAKKFSEQVTE